MTNRTSWVPESDEVNNQYYLPIDISPLMKAMMMTMNSSCQVGKKRSKMAKPFTTMNKPTFLL